MNNDLERMCDLAVNIADRARRLAAAPDALLALLGVSRELERVGDHASNIAEDVIYMVEGAIVRHHKLEQKQPVVRG